MERRGFLKLFGLGVAGIALDQAIPFNRVWSFPKNIIVPEKEVFTVTWVTQEALRILQRQFPYREDDLLMLGADRMFKVGDKISIHWPQRFLLREATPAFPPAHRPSSS